MKAVVIYILFGSIMSVFAQEAITLEKAVTYIEVQNPSVIIQRYRLEQAEKTRNQHWSRLYPVVTPTANLQLQRIDNTEAPIPGGSEPSESMNLSLGLNAAFTFVPSVIPQLQSAYLLYENQEISFNNFREQLELQARKFYFDLLLLKEVQKLLQEQYDQAKEQLAGIEQSYTSGYSSEIEVLQVRLRSESLRLELERQSSIYSNTLAAFLVLLGLESNADVAITENIEDYKVNTAFLDAVARDRQSSIYERADIRSTQREIRMNRYNRTASGLQLLPSISLSYLYNGTVNELNADNYYTDLHRFQVSLNWNLSSFFPLSSPFTGLANTKTNTALLDEQLLSQVQNANVEIDRLVGEIERSLTTIEERVLNVELAEELYARMFESYENGNVNYESLRQTELDLLAQRQQLLREQVSLIKNAFDLAYQAQVDFDAAYIKE